MTNVGSTRFDFPSAGRAYQYEYLRMFIEDSVAAVGELQARQKLPFVAYSFYDGVNRWTQMTLLMLGDPELRMYHGDFRTLAVTHPSSIALSDTQFTVSVTSDGFPVPNARVTAYPQRRRLPQRAHRPGGQRGGAVPPGDPSAA